MLRREAKRRRLRLGSRPQVPHVDEPAFGAREHGVPVRGRADDVYLRSVVAAAARELRARAPARGPLVPEERASAGGPDREHLVPAVADEAHVQQTGGVAHAAAAHLIRARERALRHADAHVEDFHGVRVAADGGDAA